MSSLAIVPKETEELAVESSALLTDAESLVIADAATYAAAAEFGKGIKALQKKIAEFFAPHKTRAHQAWKGLCDEERTQLQPTEKAEAVVKQKMIAYQAAERKRQEEERRRQEEEARRIEEARVLEEAANLETEGFNEEAAAMIEEPIVVAPPPAPRPVQKVAGIATSKRWAVDEDVDLEKLVLFISGAGRIAHPELLNLIEPNMKAIRNQVLAQRDRFSVPGIVARQIDGVSFGSK